MTALIVIAAVIYIASIVIVGLAIMAPTPPPAGMLKIASPPIMVMMIMVMMAVGEGRNHDRPPHS